MGLSEKEVAAAMEPFPHPRRPETRSDNSALSLSLTKALVEANRAQFKHQERGEHRHADRSGCSPPGRWRGREASNTNCEIDEGFPPRAIQTWRSSAVDLEQAGAALAAADAHGHHAPFRLAALALLEQMAVRRAAPVMPKGWPIAIEAAVDVVLVGIDAELCRANRGTGWRRPR